jgi:hypothetical protein
MFSWTNLDLTSSMVVVFQRHVQREEQPEKNNPPDCEKNSSANIDQHVSRNHELWSDKKKQNKSIGKIVEFANWLSSRTDSCPASLSFNRDKLVTSPRIEPDRKQDEIPKNHAQHPKWKQVHVPIPRLRSIGLKTPSERILHSSESNYMNSQTIHRLLNNLTKT